MRTFVSTLALPAILAASAAAQPTFTRIVGSGDPVPGGTATFFSFDEAPGIVGNHIAYIGSYQDGGSVTIN